MKEQKAEELMLETIIQIEMMKTGYATLFMIHRIKLLANVK